MNVSEAIETIGQVRLAELAGCTRLTIERAKLRGAFPRSRPALASAKPSAIRGFRSTGMFRPVASGRLSRRSKDGGIAPKDGGGG